MPDPKTPAYKKFIPYIKDFAYIIGILISLYGWISSKSKNEAVLETTIKYNTEAVIKFEYFMTKQVDLNTKQGEVNGTLMEFKTSHERNHE